AVGAAEVGAAVVGAAVVGAAVVASGVDVSATGLPDSTVPVVVPWHAMSAANASNATAVVLMIVLISGGCLPASTEPQDSRHVTGRSAGRFPQQVLDLPFDPDLVLGPVHLTWHALFGALGIVAG